MKNFLISLLLVCSTVQAQYQSGNELYADLTSSSPQSKMYALGYIVGVTDAVLNIVVCINPGVTQGQLQDVVKNYLFANPQNRDIPANYLVVAALGQHWPCKDRKKS